jgi:asparagine synthase (glutamine-hydrolysing)
VSLSHPFVADGLSITFDGRLHNREDLLLKMEDQLYGDTSDIALALTAYQRAGTDGFRNLIGDWSLAIWDEVRHTVVLASDYAGTRPLYYCVQDQRVLWSTRLKSLVEWAQASDIDDGYVAAFLSFGACPHRTPYRGIFSVPPGHSVAISRSGTVIQPFWALPFGDAVRYRNESDYEESLLGLFREAVRCRLPSDAPVLADLSGGLDSSSVVCMASQLMRRQGRDLAGLRTLHVGHEASLDDRFCTAVEQWCGIHSTTLSTTTSRFLSHAEAGDTLPAFWRELHERTAVLAQSFGAQIYMTGQLGDVIMGNLLDDSMQVASLVRTGHIASALKESLAWSQALQIPVFWVLGRALRSTIPSRSSKRRDPVGTSYVCEDSTGFKLGARLSSQEPHRFFSEAWTQAPLDRRRHFRGLMEVLELRILQPPELLEHLYYTHPFAHRPLVEYMLSIPAHIVCRPGEPRRLMRRAFRGLWPPELRKRRSKDLFNGVFLESLRPIARSFLKAPRQLQVVERGYMDPEDLMGRLDRLSNSLECNEPQLRQVILLELWLRNRAHSFEKVA